MEEKIWHDLWWFHRLDSVWRYNGGIKCFPQEVFMIRSKGINEMGGDRGNQQLSTIDSGRYVARQAMGYIL